MRKSVILTLIVFLYCTSLSCCCVYGDDTSASAQEAISTPILDSAPNFRDIAGIAANISGGGPTGGTGFANPTSNNGVMRTGVFYRSNVLATTGIYQINSGDLGTVLFLNIGQYIDLRTSTEISNAPNQPSLVPSININIYGTTAPVPPQPAWTVTPSEMTTYMKNLYSSFVAPGPCQVDQAAFGTLLLTLAHASTPVLYHCDAGKDRTGWTSAILESIAGVSLSTIETDYLASNIYAATLIGTVTDQIKAAYPTADPETIKDGLQVSRDYLKAALDQVTASYGSMNAYLIQGLGLTQADIYVLRAKMVYYLTLPGQNGLAGNAAAGAGLLKALQDSPLSGNYTAFNYYLQSAIDAGTLGGVENRVGGQVYADAASFLLRLSQWIDEAAMSYTRGGGLDEGQTRIWMADLGGEFYTGDPPRAASSTEYNVGTLIGATHCFNDHTSADLGLGYDWGSVLSAGAGATINTILTTIGGRYGFLSLETGPFMTARAYAGYAFLGCTRPLDGGLGDANGTTNCVLYGGLTELGDVIRFAPFTFTLQTGGRFTGVNLRSFDESGSELALDFNAINKTYFSLLFDLGVSLDRWQLGAWTITPAIDLGYERALANPSVQSTGTIYGYSVVQYSDFDSRDMSKAGFNVTAQRGAFMVTAEIYGLIAGAAESTGLNGQVSVNYRF